MNKSLGLIWHFNLFIRLHHPQQDKLLLGLPPSLVNAATAHHEGTISWVDHVNIQSDYHATFLLDEY